MEGPAEAGMSCDFSVGSFCCSGSSLPSERVGHLVDFFDGDSSVHVSMFSLDDPPAHVCPANMQSVDDFVPDEGLDKSFLEDSVTSKGKVSQHAPAPAADSDRLTSLLLVIIIYYFFTSNSLYVYFTLANVKQKKRSN